MYLLQRLGATGGSSDSHVRRICGRAVVP